MKIYTYTQPREFGLYTIPIKVQSMMIKGTVEIRILNFDFSNGVLHEKLFLYIRVNFKRN